MYQIFELHLSCFLSIKYNESQLPRENLLTIFTIKDFNLKMGFNERWASLLFLIILHFLYHSGIAESFSTNDKASSTNEGISFVSLLIQST